MRCLFLEGLLHFCGSLSQIAIMKPLQDLDNAYDSKAAKTSIEACGSFPKLLFPKWGKFI